MSWKRLVQWTRRAYRGTNHGASKSELPDLLGSRSGLRYSPSAWANDFGQPASTNSRSLPSNCARRYLPHGKIEFICLNCLHVICVVEIAQDATGFLDSHVCHHVPVKGSAVAASA